MTIITHDIIAVCLTVIRNNSGISNKIFSVCENRSLKINWHITPSALCASLSLKIDEHFRENGSVH